MEAPEKCDASDVLYWSRGRLGGWQLVRLVNQTTRREWQLVRVEVVAS